MTSYRRLLWALCGMVTWLLSGSLLLGGLSAVSQAQIRTTMTPDGTLGTAVSQQGRVYTISGGVRPAHGPNLFHSFAQFSVGTNDTASFTAPDGIKNILNRVTGGQQSIVDGHIQSKSPGVHLFLLNPSGVVFGPNATLDVGGALHVSTADALRFADGSTFAARPEGASGLTVAPPVAFGFLQARPQAITIEGSTLQVAEGQTFSVVGGDITLRGGTVAAPGGQVYIASQGAPGDVSLIPTGVVGSFQGGQVHVNGAVMSAEAKGTVDAGTITVQAAQLVITEGGSLSANAPRNTMGKAGQVHITAPERVTMTGSDPRNNSRISSNNEGIGDAGTVTMHTGQLTITGESRLTTNATTPMSGNAGQITIGAQTMTVADGGRVASQNASPGQGGQIDLQVGQLRVANGGSISVSESPALADKITPGGARLMVTATDRVVIDGQGNLAQDTGLFGRTAGVNQTPGLIQLSAPTVEITARGQITTRNSTRGSGAGQAGAIALQVGRLTLHEGARIDAGTEPGSRGDAGIVTIHASEAVTLASTEVAAEARIVSRAEGSGKGGQITLVTPRLDVATGGRLSARAAGGGQHGTLDLTQVGTLAHNGGLIDTVSELVLDGSLGPPAATLRGEDLMIDAALGQEHGANLFHSFHRFHLLPGSRATFMVRPNITTILSRVTGEAPAVIEGTLRTSSPGVALFFLAPSGVLFGLGTRLDLQGAVHVSTADYLRLDDGGQFFGSLTATSRLSASPPIALGFTSPTPAPMTMRAEHGLIAVPHGAALSLVGGDLTLAGGTLSAPGGHMQLISIASPGEVLLTAADGTPTFQLTNVTQRGVVRLGEDALLTTSSEGGGGTVRLWADEVHVNATTIEADTTGAGDAGNIAIEVGQLRVINGGQLSVSAPLASAEAVHGGGGRLIVSATESVLIDQQASTRPTGLFGKTTGQGQRPGLIQISAPTIALLGGAQVTTETMGAGHAGQIVLQANQVTLAGAASTGTVSAMSSSTSSSGDAGAIAIDVGQLTLLDGGTIAARALPNSTGQGGRVTITATERVTVAGQGGPSGSEIRSDTEGPGNAGTIEIHAPLVQVLGMAAEGTNRILTSASALSRGAAGQIRIVADGVIVADGGRIASTNSGTGAGGAAGQIRIVADGVIVADGGRIASTNSGTGAAGQIDIQVQQLIVADGGSISISVSPPTANTASDGGGTLTITATDRVVIDGQNSTARSTALFGRTTGRSQKPGLISVSAPSIDIKSSGLISTVTEGEGQGGNIALHAGRLTLTDGGRLTTSSTSTAPGAGDAGAITITADTVSLAQSRVATDSTVADGGNVHLQARGLVRLQDSTMTTAVRSGSGRGGNIRMGSDLVVLDQSQILADAFGGPGGNVRIVTQGFVADPTSQVSASSAQNVQGIVDIQALTTFNGTVAPLPPDFTPAGVLLWERCAERLREGTVSSFVIRGRASLPAAYDSILPSRLYEPQQPQTSATGMEPPPQETTVSSQNVSGSAAAFSSRRLDLRCGRP